MGYLTSFTMSHDGDPKVVHAAMVAFPKAEFDYAFGVREGDDPQTSYETQEKCKWYSHNADMRELSLKCPGVLFTTEGIGEDYPDVWKSWHKDGKMWRVDANITFPEYDETKLR